MKNPSIKFSHHYAKLRACEPEMKATLILVLVVKLEELPKTFIDYDTDDGVYKLPKKGEYMMLFFEGSRGLITTMRRAYPLTKVDYYNGMIGKTFDIIISPEK